MANHDFFFIYGFEPNLTMKPFFHIFNYLIEEYATEDMIQISHIKTSDDTKYKIIPNQFPI